MFLSNSLATGMENPAFSNPRSNHPHPLNMLTMFDVFCFIPFLYLFAICSYSILKAVLLFFIFLTSTHVPIIAFNPINLSTGKHVLVIFV